MAGQWPLSCNSRRLFFLAILIIIAFLFTTYSFSDHGEYNIMHSIGDVGMLNVTVSLPVIHTFVSDVYRPALLPQHQGIGSYAIVPKPDIDSRIVPFGREDVLKLEKISEKLFSLHPQWIYYHRHVIRELIEAPGALYDPVVLNLYDELLFMEKFGDIPHPLGAYRNMLPILKQRHFLKTKRPALCDNCFVYDYETVMEPKSVRCSTGESVDILAFITTIPGAEEARTTIRNTWGTYSRVSKGRFKLIFSFGSGWSPDQEAIIAKENDKYGDILMGGFQDNYYNLTYKVLMGYTWAETNCPQAKFLMRSADDEYIDVPKMLGLVTQFGDTTPFRDYQVGRCYVGTSPYRGLGFKGFVNTFEYENNTFPPFAHGTTFLTSKALTKSILRMSVNVPFFHIEDVYFGFVLAALGSGCTNVGNEEEIFSPKHPVSTYDMQQLWRKHLLSRINR